MEQAIALGAATGVIIAVLGVVVIWIGYRS